MQNLFLCRSKVPAKPPPSDQITGRWQSRKVKMYRYVIFFGELTTIPSQFNLWVATAQSLLSPELVLSPDVILTMHAVSCAGIYGGFCLTLFSPMLAEKNTIDANRLLCDFYTLVGEQNSSLISSMLLQNVWLFRGGLVLS